MRGEPRKDYLRVIGPYSRLPAAHQVSIILDAAGLGPDVGLIRELEVRG
jgi:hypothetical protein